MKKRNRNENNINQMKLWVVIKKSVKNTKNQHTIIEEKTKNSKINYCITLNDQKIFFVKIILNEYKFKCYFEMHFFTREYYSSNILA